MSYRAVAPAGSDDVESIGIGDSGGTSQDLRSDGRYEGGEQEDQHVCPFQSGNTERMRDNTTSDQAARIIRQRAEGARQLESN